MDRGVRNALIIGGMVLAVIILAGSLWGGRYYGYGMMGGFMGLMWIGWLVIIGLIIWAVVAAARSGGGQAGSGGESAMDLLKKRYARGEINKDEFEQKKKDLMG